MYPCLHVVAPLAIPSSNISHNQTSPFQHWGLGKFLPNISFSLFPRFFPDPRPQSFKVFHLALHATMVIAVDAHVPFDKLWPGYPSDDEEGGLGIPPDHGRKKD